MNVRKPVDYRDIYQELTTILAQNLPQMNEIYAIGKVISQRSEKGVAVAAAEFLQANFPDRTGFSPRNVRRMRDFYKVYENDGPLLRLAMKIGWTLNVVIMEAALTRDARHWYLRKANAGALSKAELLEMIESAAHLEKSLDESKQDCYTKENYKLPLRMQSEGKLVRLLQSDDQSCDEGLGKESWNDVSRLQRQLRRQDIPPDELCRPPWQCGGFMLHRRLQCNMVGCAGSLSIK